MTLSQSVIVLRVLTRGERFRLRHDALIPDALLQVVLLAARLTLPRIGERQPSFL